MRAFFFDKYGYHVKEEYSSEFDYQNWHFKLEANSKTEQELLALKNFMMEVTSSYNEPMIDIIYTRDHHLMANSEFGQVSLVAVKNGKYTINDIIRMHHQYLNFSPTSILTVSYLKSLWINKVEIMEEKVIPQLKIDEYLYNIIFESTIYAIGLAMNAIQYLEDIRIDYKDEIKNTTLVHKRLTSFDNYAFYNPFNLTIDSPMRDIGEMYKFGLINEQDIVKILSNYQIDAKEASLLLARVLFPTYLFDLLEDHFAVKKDIHKEIIEYKKNTKKMLGRITYLYQYLLTTYGIRPIEWLNQ